MYPGHREGRLEELLEAILQRLREPIEVCITIEVINESNPPVRMILTPSTPKENT